LNEAKEHLRKTKATLVEFEEEQTDWWEIAKDIETEVAEWRRDCSTAANVEGEEETQEEGETGGG